MGAEREYSAERMRREMASQLQRTQLAAFDVGDTARALARLRTALEEHMRGRVSMRLGDDGISDLVCEFSASERWDQARRFAYVETTSAPAPKPRLTAARLGLDLEAKATDEERAVISELGLVFQRVFSGKRNELALQESQTARLLGVEMAQSNVGTETPAMTFEGIEHRGMRYTTDDCIVSHGISMPGAEPNSFRSSSLYRLRGSEGSTYAVVFDALLNGREWRSYIDCITTYEEHARRVFARSAYMACSCLIPPGGRINKIYADSAERAQEPVAVFRPGGDWEERRAELIALVREFTAAAKVEIGGGDGDEYRLLVTLHFDKMYRSMKLIGETLERNGAFMGFLDGACREGDLPAITEFMALEDAMSLAELMRGYAEMERLREESGGNLVLRNLPQESDGD